MISVGCEVFGGEESLKAREGKERGALWPGTIFGPSLFPPPVLVGFFFGNAVFPGIAPSPVTMNGRRRFLFALFILLLSPGWLLANVDALHVRLGEALRDGELQLADRYLAEARAETLDAADHARFELLAGDLYRQRYDYRNAMSAYLAADRYYTGTGDANGQLHTKTRMGELFYLEENYERAEALLTEALNLPGVTADRSRSQESVAEVQLARTHYGRAKTYFEQALRGYLAAQRIDDGARTARRLGALATQLGDHDGALTYYQTSLDLHGSQEDLSGIAEDLHLIAATLLAQDDLDGAESEGLRALDLRRQLNVPVDLAATQQLLAEVYTRLDRPAEALTYLERAGVQLEAATLSGRVPALYARLAASYAALGLPERAYLTQLEATRQRAAATERDKAQALLQLTTKYQSEYAAAEQARQIRELERTEVAQRRIMGFLLAGVVLTLLLAATLYRNYRNERRAKRLLQAKNAEIERQHAHIERQHAQLEEQNLRLDTLNGQLVNEMAEREAIEKSSFARDRFLATMSNEMRNPINVISGLSHILLDEAPRADQVEHLRQLQFSANNLLVFINDVLDFSKIEAGKLELQSREYAPARILQEVQQGLVLAAADKEVQLRYRYDEHIPRRLLGDSARLYQIIVQLVNTSLQYMSEGQIVVAVDLHERRPDGGQLRLRITDDGPGIAPARLDKLLHRYERPGDDIFEGHTPQELGLAITRRLIELQHGRLEVDSRPGIGTVFTVFLPYQLPISNNNENPEATSADGLAGKCILLVEDNKINQLVVAKLLRKLGVEVHTADDGLQGLELFERTTFDLVLMDIQMPRMDGYRATAEIRKHADPAKRSVPIVALTASAFLTAKEKARLFGMNDHVGKPFGREELVAKVSAALRAEKRTDPVATGRGRN